MTAAASYSACPIKRARRSKSEMEAIKASIYAVVSVDHPMTVRQTFYRLVSAGVIDKSEAEYQGTVIRLLTDMRRSGEIPWGWITDYTRYRRKPRSFANIEDAMADTAEFYRRALWSDLDTHVECWLEKEALSGVLFHETSKYDVPLMVTKGYPSLSFLHAAGEEIAGIGKRTFVYYFGDHDPSGVDIPRKVEAGLREFAPDIEIYFERVAVVPAQIIQYGLPTRPTKKSDSRSRSFDGESVEVDAIPPAELRNLCRDRIEQHLSDDLMQTHIAAEESERQLLHAWAGGDTA